MHFIYQKRPRTEFFCAEALSSETDMPPDGGTAIHESQLLRAFGAPTAAAIFVIRAAALLTHTV